MGQAIRKTDQQLAYLKCALQLISRTESAFERRCYEQLAWLQLELLITSLVAELSDTNKFGSIFGSRLKKQYFAEAFDKLVDKSKIASGSNDKHCDILTALVSLECDTSSWLARCVDKVEQIHTPNNNHDIGLGSDLLSEARGGMVTSPSEVGLIASSGDLACEASAPSRPGVDLLSKAMSEIEELLGRTRSLSAEY